MNKLAPRETDSRLFITDVSANLKVMWQKNQDKYKNLANQM